MKETNTNEYSLKDSLYGLDFQTGSKKKTNL